MRAILCACYLDVCNKKMNGTKGRERDCKCGTKKTFYPLLSSEPSNYGGLSRTDIVAPGQSIAFPGGWLHLQVNDNYTALEAVLVWSGVNSGGTTNVPQALSTLEPAYSQVGWVAPLPASAPTNWVVDPTCAVRCGINATSSPAPSVSTHFQEQAAADGVARLYGRAGRCDASSSAGRIFFSFFLF